MSVQIIIGDAMEQLRLLPSDSVHCVVTSPPYYGLRDYGTAQWDGGDAGCDHKKVIDPTRAVEGSTLHGGQKTNGHLQEGYKSHCARCGARRIDQQIGLEPSPDEYVARLVDVFRAVRRVLRKDGTVWLNLGMSYASGDSGSSRSRQRKHAPPCDSDGKEPQDYPGSGYACRGPDDEHLSGSQSHLGRTADNRRLSERDEQRLSLTDHDSAPLDCASSFPGLSQSGVQRSTIPALTASAQGAFSRASAVAGLSEVRTLPDDARLSAHTTDDMPDTFEQSPPSVHRMTDKLSSGLACNCGSCGICFIYLVTKSLRFKPKDEINIPHLVAMALQADGWFLRQTIIWAKPNPMPESVTDRCTKAHEYLFLLSKSPRYFYDADAIKEPAVSDHTSGNGFVGRQGGSTSYQVMSGGVGSTKEWVDIGGTRNRRSVWTVASEAFPGSHFAVFPPALIQPCILAGTSERGVCAACGAPWVRLVDWGHDGTRDVRNIARALAMGHDARGPTAVARAGEPRSSRTLGWQPACSCDAATVPATVIDPFAGAGTTGLVADRLGRSAILIELNPAYAELARRRIEQDAPLFAEVREPARAAMPIQELLL